MDARERVFAHRVRRSIGPSDSPGELSEYPDAEVSDLSARIGMGAAAMLRIPMDVHPVTGTPFDEDGDRAFTRVTMFVTERCNRGQSLVYRGFVTDVDVVAGGQEGHYHFEEWTMRPAADTPDGTHARMAALRALLAADVAFVAPSGELYAFTNDTFDVACADGEHIPEDRWEEVAAVHERFGSYGVLAWAALQRDATPLPSVTDHPAYRRAFEALST